MTTTTVSYSGPRPLGQLSLHAHGFQLTALSGEQRAIYCGVANSTIAPLQNELARHGVADPTANVDQCLILYGVHSIDRALTSPAFQLNELAIEGTTWLLNDDDIEWVVRLAVESDCSYRARRERDLFCSAASLGDGQAIYVIDGRRAAPTSMPLCAKCELPSTDWLCESLSHPQVSSLSVQGDLIVRKNLIGALCNKGQANIDDPADCRPGGNSCWTRSVESGTLLASPRASGSTLPDALDGLNAYWMLSFGRSNSLLAIHSLSSPSELLLDCSNREEFKSRVSALTDIFDKLHVADELLPSDVAEARTVGSINRIELALEKHLPADSALELAGVLRPIRRSRTLRVALQHTGGRSNLSGELAFFGATSTTTDWSSAIDLVRSHCADAVNRLRVLLFDAMPR